MLGWLYGGENRGFGGWRMKISRQSKERRGATRQEGEDGGDIVSSLSPISG